MNHIDVIQLIQDDEEFAPPAKVLRLSLVESTVFLSICNYEETRSTTKTKAIAEFNVDFESLLSSLLTLAEVP